MRIELYRLRGEGDERLLDFSRPIARIRVTDGHGEIEILDPAKEKTVRRKFEEGQCEFVGGGQGPDGVCFDAVESYDPWTPRAIELALQSLDGIGIGNRIVEDP